jgi:hypothetical protein
MASYLQAINKDGAAFAFQHCDGAKTLALTVFHSCIKSSTGEFQTPDPNNLEIFLLQEDLYNRTNRVLFARIRSDLINAKLECNCGLKQALIGKNITVQKLDLPPFPIT